MSDDTNIKKIPEAKKKGSGFKKFSIVILIVIAVLFGDRMIASVAFKFYCATQPGLYVYEKIELSDEYFLPLPEKNTREYRSISHPWFYDESYYFNKAVFVSKYNYVFQEYKQIFPLGAIFQHRAFVTRIKDEKLLSEALSFSNNRGWIYDSKNIFFSKKEHRCPSGRNTRNEPLFSKNQGGLLRETFIRSN